METLIDAFAVVLPILYTLTVVGHARQFVGLEGGLERIRTPLLIVTLTAHAASIAARAVVVGACPVVGAADQLSLSAFVVAGMALGVRARLGADDSTGFFVVAGASLLQLAASVLSIGAVPTAAAPPFWPSLHIFCALVGLSAVVVTALYGLLFLLLYRAISKSRFNLFFERLPDLQTLSKVNVRAAIIAFALLSTSAAVGFERAVVDGQEYHTGRVVLATSLWLLYGTALIGHWFFRLNGRKLASVTFLGLLLAIPVHVINIVEGSTR